MFLWALALSFSLPAIVLVWWFCFSLAYEAQLGPHNNTWLLLLAGLATLAPPLVTISWKYGSNGRKWANAVAWVPLLWCLGLVGLLIGLVPAPLATGLRSSDLWLAKQLGDHSWVTQKLSGFSHLLADVLDPTSAVLPVAPVRVAPVRVAPATAVVVPFSAAGNAILMDVELRGPAGRLSSTYLFDTGASFTTISSQTAAKLGLEVPANAPTLQFNTASGPRESPMVYLPALRLGDTVLEGLLVSVCDGCVNDRSDGLLGLNVMREFHVEVDYQAEQMHLIPRQHEGRANRAYDIAPAVQISVEGTPEIWLGRIRWVIVVNNRSSVAMTGIVPEVTFSNGQRLRGTAIDRIEAGRSGRSRVEGTTHKQEDKDLSFTLTVAEGYW